VDAVLNEDWTADVVGRMHRCRISNALLAKESGYSAAYLSTVLNGNKDLSADGKEQTKDKIFKALERLESRVLTTGSADSDAAD